GSINVTGSYAGGGTYTPSPVTGTPAVEDPLKYLPAPSAPSAGQIVSKTPPGSGNFQYVPAPGSSGRNGGPNMPKFQSGDQVVFQQASANSAGGIYYLYAGIQTNGANLSMDAGTSGGIMLYNAGTKTSDKIDITGNSSGTVNLSALDGSV